MDEPAVAVGFWSSEDELRANWVAHREWRPARDWVDRERAYALWKKAVARTLDRVD